MQRLFLRIAEGQLFFLLLNSSHDFLRALVHRRHDVRHAQVRQYNRRHLQHVVLRALIHGLVEFDRFAELVVLHEERVRQVQLPRVVVAAILNRLAVETFNHRVVLDVPVDLRLRHEHGNVFFKCTVILLKRARRHFRVRRVLGVLDLLRELAEGLNVLLAEDVKLAVGLGGGGLRGDAAVEEIIQVLRQELHRQVRVLCEHIRGEVEVLIFGVEEQQVVKRLGRERGVLEKVIEFLEALRRVVRHVHNRRVVQSDGVELGLGARRHVRERLLRRKDVFHHVLDGALEVEGLDQRGLFQRLRVADAANVQPFRVGADRHLRVLVNALLYDLGDVLKRRAPLLELVERDGAVVCKVGVPPERRHRVLEHVQRLLVLPLAVQHAPAHDGDVRVLDVSLVELLLAGLVLL
eukprot:PhM_4_TR1501/c0_g1_i1/m.45888